MLAGKFPVRVPVKKFAWKNSASNSASISQLMKLSVIIFVLKIIILENWWRQIIEVS